MLGQTEDSAAVLARASASEPEPALDSQLNHSPDETEGLKQMVETLQNRLDFLEEKASAAKEPKPAQLAAFLRDSSSMLSKPKVPAWASELLDDAMEQLGWDRAANSSRPGSKPPTVKAVRKMLKDTQEGINIVL